MYKELRDIGFDDKDIEDFRNEFWESGKDSVDAFLEHRPSFLEIGKVAIAQELTRYELHNELFETQGDNLYFYLYKHLNAMPDEFQNNALTVVTYNYDRSFEHFLFTAFKRSYGLSDETTARLLEHVPIIHLHGHLGLLPWQGGKYLKYGKSNLSRDTQIRLASENIRIIHEDMDIEKVSEFTRAHACTNEANRIVFLGFGYDKINLERLRMPESQNRLAIHGSCYKLTRTERISLNNRFFHGNATLGGEEQDALMFLRDGLLL